MACFFLFWLYNPSSQSAFHGCCMYAKLLHGLVLFWQFPGGGLCRCLWLLFSPWPVTANMLCSCMLEVISADTVTVSIRARVFLWVGCSSIRRTNTVIASWETENTGPNEWNHPLALSFLHPLLEIFSLYTGCLMPVSSIGSALSSVMMFFGCCR